MLFSLGVSGPCSEEAVGEDDDDGGSDGDFDLPQRGEEKREEREINKDDVHGVATEGFFALRRVALFSRRWWHLVTGKVKFFFLVRMNLSY